MDNEIKHKTAYLFDMDGTLVNTEPVGPRVFEKLFADHGARLSNDEKELFIKVWRRDGTDIKEDAYIETLRQRYAISVAPDTFLRIFFDSYKQAIITADALYGVDAFFETSAQAWH